MVLGGWRDRRCRKGGRLVLAGVEMTADDPYVPRFRIIVASIILAMWVVLHLADSFFRWGGSLPYVDAMFGAVVTWLFGSPILNRKNQ